MAPSGPEGGASEKPVDPLRTLVLSAVSGDQAAQRTLLSTLGPALLRAIRGVLGLGHPELEDVLQEAMAAVHAALPGFRGECLTVHFASRVAAQTAMNVRRRAGHRARHVLTAPPDELVDLIRDDRSPAEVQAVAVRRHRVRQLLDDLPATQAEVLVLHVILGYSVEETATMTAAPRNTVRSRLRAALSSLRTRVHSDAALLEILDGEP